MKNHQHRLPDADAIRDQIGAIEGCSSTVEVLTHERSRPREVKQLCAFVRSTASRRVYLVVHGEAPVAGWQPPCEIIGFDGLRVQMRVRHGFPEPKRKTARRGRKTA